MSSPVAKRIKKSLEWMEKELKIKSDGDDSDDGASMAWH